MQKILQISDLHILAEEFATLKGIDTAYYFAKVLNEAHTEHGQFDLILVSGDLAQQPCEKSYAKILTILDYYQTKTVCLPGNHDDYRLMLSVLNSKWVSCAKQLNLKDWHLICLNSQKLDSAIGTLSTEELLFLEQSLISQPNLATLVAVHHHCFPSGSAWLDTMQITNSAEFLNLIKQYDQVKAVTFGHVHQEMQTEINGIPCFSTPATCFQFQPNNEEFIIEDKHAGYRIIELHPQGHFNTRCYRINEPLRGLTLDDNSCY